MLYLVVVIIISATEDEEELRVEVLPEQKLIPGMCM